MERTLNSILLDRLADKAGFSTREYMPVIIESWINDHTYECPECGYRVVNGDTCSCKASDRE